MLRLQKDRNLSRFEAEVSASIMGVDIDKMSVDEYGVISNTGKTLNQVLRMANHKDLPDAEVGVQTLHLWKPLLLDSP